MFKILTFPIPQWLFALVLTSCLFTLDSPSSSAPALWPVRHRAGTSVLMLFWYWPCWRGSHSQQRRQQLHHIKTHLAGEDQFLQSHMQGAELPDGSCSGERSSLTPQTPKFSLSFPTPSRCYIGNFSIPNLKCPNTQPRGQSLSWPFLQPKEYEMSL